MVEKIKNPWSEVHYDNERWFDWLHLQSWVKDNLKKEGCSEADIDKFIESMPVEFHFVIETIKPFIVEQCLKLAIDGIKGRIQ